MSKTIRLKLLKALPVDGDMRNANSIVDVAEGQALYFIGMGDAKRAGADETLSTPPPPIPFGTKVASTADEMKQRAEIEKQNKHMEAVEAKKAQMAELAQAKVAHDK